MRIGFQEFCMNPPFPVKRMKQNAVHQITADDLHGRILLLGKAGKDLYHISLDTVEIQRTYREKIKIMIEDAVQREIDLIVSATHSHNCPCLTTDIAYQDFVLENIRKAVMEMRCQELSLSISHRCEFFDGIGRSRVKGITSDSIYAEVVSFWHQNTRLGSMLIHNVHPTIEALWKNDFTAEYPGALIRCLKARYPEEFFTFVMGPAGEISPRYVRRNQEHGEMLRLAGILANEFDKLLSDSGKKVPLSHLRYEEIELPIKRINRRVENLEIPDDFEDEEKTLIKSCLSEPPVDLEALQQKHIFSRLQFPDYVMIFEPFELFSEYYHAVRDKETCTLVTISNGYDDYVTGIEDQPLSFEYLKDTVSDETKENIIALLEKWSSDIL